MALQSADPNQYYLALAPACRSCHGSCSKGHMSLCGKRASEAGRCHAMRLMYYLCAEVAVAHNQGALPDSKRALRKAACAATYRLLLVILCQASCSRSWTACG